MREGCECGCPVQHVTGDGDDTVYTCADCGKERRVTLEHCACGAVHIPGGTSWVKALGLVHRNDTCDMPRGPVN